MATIQKEQNDIIRDTKHELLLVQGVLALVKLLLSYNGSPFCSIIVEINSQPIRSSYFRLTCSFSHYISEVLPSLGERNMRQVTLAEFLAQRFQGLKVETLFDRYENSVPFTADQRKIRAKKKRLVSWK